MSLSRFQLHWLFFFFLKTLKLLGFVELRVVDTQFSAGKNEEKSSESAQRQSFLFSCWKLRINLFCFAFSGFVRPGHFESTRSYLPFEQRSKNLAVWSSCIQDGGFTAGFRSFVTKRSRIKKEKSVENSPFEEKKNFFLGSRFIRDVYSYS